MTKTSGDFDVMHYNTRYHDKKFGDTMESFRPYTGSNEDSYMYDYEASRMRQNERRE